MKRTPHFTIACLFGLAVSLTLPAFQASGADGPSDGPSAAKRPNVLLIVTDDQRPDTIRALGNKIIETATLDGLVRDGTTFTRAIAPCPICTPSRAEIMTGVSGVRTKHRLRGRKQTGPEPVLWAQTMRDAGYVSWYVGKWMNDGRPVNRGYDRSNGLFRGGGKKYWTDRVDYRGHEVTGYVGWIFQTDDGTLKPELGVGLTANISKHFADAAIELLKSKPDKPFFMHVNFTAPHDPLLIPPGYKDKYKPEQIPLPPNFKPEHPFDHGNARGRDEMLLPFPRTPKVVRKDLAAYYAVLSHMDHHLGRILAALDETGQADNTIVIFTSDHGLAIGSHGLRGKQNMYDHTVGTPLIFRGPNIPKRQRSDAQCYLRDLYPTVCELVGVEIPKTVEGLSLAPVLQGKAKSVRECVFGHYSDCQRMIRTDRWKLIHYPKIEKYQLFDLSADPNELKNLADDPQHAQLFDRLRAKLAAWEREI